MMTTLFIQLLAAFAALVIGLKLPDIDLAPLLFRHRSAFTHGPAWALILPRLAEGWPWWTVYVTPALLVGIALHLLADSFPKAWVGSALVNTFPFKLRLSPAISFAWIIGSAVYTAHTVWSLL